MQNLEASIARSCFNYSTEHKMEKTWNTSVELSMGEEDWIQTRDCLVRAFQNYPLYTYMIPNKDKRPEFLKQYLEAIYDVLVRNGNSVLVCVKLTQNEDVSQSAKAKKVAIGGVLFVPPSLKGGWESQHDEDFWQAYRKYGLKDLDEEALKRIEKYEKWEYETISRYVCKSGIPMWNGVICGIDPNYAGRGCGSLSYDKCLNVLTQALQRRTKHTKKTFRVKRVFRRLYGKMWLPKFEKKTHVPAHRQTPAILAISHCLKAINFHKKNGFYHVADIPFPTSESNGKSPEFVATVLMLSMNSDTKSVKLKKEFQVI